MSFPPCTTRATGFLVYFKCFFQRTTPQSEIITSLYQLATNLVKAGLFFVHGNRPEASQTYAKTFYLTNFNVCILSVAGNRGEISTEPGRILGGGFFWSKKH